MQRLKHEANTLHTGQLKEAAVLQEVLDGLKVDHEQAEGKLTGLHEYERQQDYAATRRLRDDEETRVLKHGFLRSQARKQSR